MKFSELKDLFEESGYEPRSYSGRGMFGKACLGVVTARTGACVVCDVISEFIRNSGLEADECLEAVQELTEELIDASEDSMGCDSIIYWPSIQWENDSEDTDNDSEE